MEAPLRRRSRHRRQDPFALNAYPLTVVGVAAPSFHGTIVSFDVEIPIPVMMAPQIGLSFGTLADPADVYTRPTSRANYFLIVQGRLRPGATLAEASLHSLAVL